MILAPIKVETLDDIILTEGVLKARVLRSRLPLGRPREIFDRVMEKVEFRRNGCWLWTGPHSGYHGRGKLYPRMSLDGATVAVHRIMWALQNGPIPPRKQVDHKCCNRGCVNPLHLEMVTHRENQRRRDKKETQA